ncbi:hypothetical protein TNCV_4600921 [Trichonephila clavipes]|nr:hypothetical protein TNCV_4600921 [Trichonephila clavipes]
MRAAQMKSDLCDCARMNAPIADSSKRSKALERKPDEQKTIRFFNRTLPCSSDEDDPENRLNVGGTTSVNVRILQRHWLTRYELSSQSFVRIPLITTRHKLFLHLDTPIPKLETPTKHSKHLPNSRNKLFGLTDRISICNRVRAMENSYSMKS